MSTATAAPEETIFRNTTQGWLGAVKIDGRGVKESVAIEPGGTISLTEEEQAVTARAPRDPQNNPFLEQEYEIRDPNTGEVLESGRRAPLAPDTEERFIPGAGSRDDREETGTTTAGSTRAKRTSKPRQRRATKA